MVLIIVVLILAAVLGVFGFVVKGLLWLAIIGLIIFIACAALATMRRRR